MAEASLHSTAEAQAASQAASSAEAKPTAGQSPASSVAAGLAGAGAFSKERASEGDANPVEPGERPPVEKSSSTPPPQVRGSIGEKDPLPVPDEEKATRTSDRVNPYEKIDQPNPRREPALRAQQIMSSPVLTVSSEDTIRDAAKLFREKRFRHLPVVSEEGKLVGIISDRDTLPVSDRTDPIKEHMATAIISARPETEIRKIASVFFHERIGAMPILDENGSVSGILTRSDILRTLVNKAPLELWV